MKKHYRHENDCLNCGTILEGKFCHNCGQENLQIKESFGHMMNHAISDYFHFDQQFFHTLKPLFFSPGKLTNEYMAGRRAQFLHPVKMYIFISLIYFLLVFKENKEADKVEVKQINTEHFQDSVKKVAIDKIKNNKDLTPEQKKETIAAITKPAGHHVKKHIPVDTAHKAGLNIHVKPIDSLNKDDDDDDDSVTGDVFEQGVATTTDDSTYTQYLATQKKLPEAERDGLFTRYFNEKAFALKNPKINKKKLIKEGIEHNFPKMMFLLLPLFALILKITFWKNKKFYVEHLIFSFHLHCFVFLFLTIIMILKMILPDTGGWVGVIDWINIISTLVIIWYIYRALRVMYHRSKWRTFTKMFGMSLTYTLAFSICMLILVVVTALTVV
ncbi:DUF3667 domain-containing protein [Mucilaginibacter sp. X4EP1]|uniref:DUF3667 domain-containing protein n=1 Tax=Mucilaginibacter sp. X4EP1 TaxID=2723092 RepID=UPI00216A8996|nr:DUF3667 domain-containing protein [Mucilaginibacter sp. X4EP1]MCS3813252.1 hypothetical protein [Mucilaginibacter sp. X4EP1]